MAIIWTSKVNIVSNVYDVYGNPDKLKQIEDEILSNFSDKPKCQFKDEYTLDDEIKSIESEYQFVSIEKLNQKYNYSICGFMVKSQPIGIKSVNRSNGKTIFEAVENDEKILFYYDVYRELVLFHETQRFKHKQFNKAFSTLLNMIMEDSRYMFKLSLLSEKINIENVKKELSRLGKIKELYIEIKPPNPGKKLLKDLEKYGLENIEEMKSACIAEKQVIYKANKNDAININSKLINDSLDEVSAFHSSITADESLKNGYVVVAATNDKGKIITSDEMDPLKRTIRENDIVPNKFADISKDFIIQTLSSAGEKHD